jgi:D-glycero-D-manno-heptose 1,7-bisphosphate phosphatase
MGQGNNCYGWRREGIAANEWSGSAPWRAVFLDRDGTINVAPRAGEYVKHPRSLKLLPGASGAIRTVNNAGAPVVVVTNQRWLATSDDPNGRFRVLDRHLRSLLARDGARIDACYACAHEIGRCGCRKPRPGMFLRAAAELDLDLRASAAIGDSVDDMVAAKAAGVGSRILIGTSRQTSSAPVGCRLAANLEEAVRWAV